MIKLFLYRFLYLFLDVLSIPVTFMSSKNNAKYHLKIICPMCPKCRRESRDVYSNGQCFWEHNWKNENYNIPRFFGMFNWLRSYFGIKTDLKRFKTCVK